MKGGVAALKEHGEDDNIADSNEAVIALHQFPSVLDSGGPRPTMMSTMSTL